MRGKRSLASRGGLVKSLLQVFSGEASRSRQLDEKLCVKDKRLETTLVGIWGPSRPVRRQCQRQSQSHCGEMTLPISQGDPDIGEACQRPRPAAVMHCNSIRAPASRFARAAARGGRGGRSQANSEACAGVISDGRLRLHYVLPTWLPVSRG